MVRVDDAVIARLKKGGDTFEVLVDCDQALAYREGKIDDLSSVLATRLVFKDVKLGLKASETEMKKLFHTEDPENVAAEIVKHGEIQLTTEHKNQLREQKRKQIVHFIHRNAVDPKTGLPHPPQRIDAAMQGAKIKVDEFRTVEEQVPEIMIKLRSVIPIKIEVHDVEVVIPAKYAGNALGSLKRMAKVLTDEWLNDGSLKAVIEIPAGIQEEVETELNKITRGDVTINIVRKR